LAWAVSLCRDASLGSRRPGESAGGGGGRGRGRGAPSAVARAPAPAPAPAPAGRAGTSRNQAAQQAAVDGSMHGRIMLTCRCWRSATPRYWHRRPTRSCPCPCPCPCPPPALDRRHPSVPSSARQRDAGVEAPGFLEQAAGHTGLKEPASRCLVTTEPPRGARMPSSLRLRPLYALSFLRRLRVLPLHGYAMLALPL